MLTKTGKVYAVGYNGYGNLCDNSNTNRSSPVESKLPDNEIITKISTGTHHTLALTSKGQVFSWGYNAYGQLGNGTTSTGATNTYQTVRISKKIIDVYTEGEYSSYVIDSNRDVYSFGHNNYGQLGIGNTSNKSFPEKVQNVSNVIKIALGQNHSMFLQDDKTVWACGQNNNYQLGDGTVTTRNAPVQVMSDHKIVDIASSYNSSYFLTDKGEIYAVGVNTHGLFGNGNVTRLNNPTLIMNDYQDLFKMFTSGQSESVFYGRNPDTIRIDTIEASLDHNRLNYNVDIVSANKPITWFVFATTKDVTNAMIKAMVESNEYKSYPLVYHTGVLDETYFNSSYIQNGELNFVMLADKTIQNANSVNVAKIIICLETETEFLVDTKLAYLDTAQNDYPYSIITNTFYDINKSAYTVEGFVYSNGEKATNISVAGFVPNLITDATTKAQAKDFIIAQASSDENIKTLDNVDANSVVPFAFDISNMINSITDASSDYHTSINVDSIVDFRVAVQGETSGNKTMSDVFTLPNERKNIKVIKTLATGLNANYQLMDGTNIQKTSVVETAMLDDKDILFISTGDRRTFVVTTDYTVYAIGLNDNGELGYGDAGNKSSFVQVMSGKNVCDIQCGHNHTVFLTKDNKVFATGHNANGHYGTNNTTQYVSPQEIMSDYKIVSVAAGYYHTLFVTEDGEVYATGYNIYSQLGDGTATQRTKPVRVLINDPIKKVFSTGSSNVSNYFLTRDGKVYASGYNGHGQLGNGTTTNTNVTTHKIPTLVQFPDENINIVDIACGDYHTLFLTDDSKVYACGYNNVYQLGDTTNTNRNTPVQVMSSEKILNINTGRNNSFFMTHNLEIYAVGENNQGELSINNTTQVNTPTRILETYNNIFNIFTSKYADSTYFVTGNYKDLIKINSFDNGCIALDEIRVESVSVQQTTATVIKAYVLASTNHALTSEQATTLIRQNNKYCSFTEIHKSDYTVVEDDDLSKNVIVSSVAEIALNVSISSVLNSDNTTFESHLKANKIKMFLLVTDDFSTDVKELTVEATNVHIDNNSTSIYPVIENIVFSDSDNKLYVSGSLYGSDVDITSYYVTGFVNNLDNTNYSGIATYIMDNSSASNVEVVSQTLTKNKIHSFEHTFTSVFDSIDSTPDTTQSIQEGVYYDFRIVAVSASGEKVVSDRFVRYIEADYDRLYVKSIYATGLNHLGQLINGNTTQLTSPVQILDGIDIRKVFMGTNRAAYITNNNEVYMIGQNGNGELGIGTVINTTTAVQLMLDQDIIITKIAMGHNHVVFLTEEGDVYGCGYNGNGHYGTNNTTQYNTPQLIMSNAIDIAVGYYHTLIVKNTGQVQASGYNVHGQLGDGTTTQRTSFVSININNKSVVKVFCTGSSNESSYFLTKDGEVYACGYNAQGQLGVGNTASISTPTLVLCNNERVVDMACGFDHVLFLTASSKVLVCGNNDIGQLSTSTGGNKSTPEYSTVSDKYRVRGIFAGKKNSFFVTENYSLFAVGENNNGEMGNGNVSNVSTLTEIQKTYIPSMYKVVSSAFNDSTFFITTNVFNVPVVNSINVTLDPSTYLVNANISTGNKECRWYAFGSLDTNITDKASIKTFVDNNIIGNTDNLVSIKTGVVPANSVYELSESITSLFDLDLNIRSADTVNTVTTCLYVSDNGAIPSFDGLHAILSHNQELFGLNYQVYPKVLDMYYDYMQMKYFVKCSAYSSTDIITDIYVVAFNNSLVSINEDNLESVMSYIVNTNQNPIQHSAINLSTNQIGEFIFEFTNMMNSLDVTDTTVLTSYSENIEFRVVLVTASGNKYMDVPGQVASQGKGGGFGADSTEHFVVNLQSNYNITRTKVVANVNLQLPEVNKINMYMFVSTVGDLDAATIKTTALSDVETVHKFMNVTSNIENYEIETMLDSSDTVVKVNTALDVYVYLYSNSPDTTRIEQVHKYRVTTTDGRNNAIIYATTLQPYGKLNNVFFNSHMKEGSGATSSVIVKGSVISSYGSVNEIYVLGFDSPNLVSSITNIENLILSASQSSTTSVFIRKFTVNVPQNEVYAFETTVDKVFDDISMTSAIDIEEDRYNYFHDYRILVVDTTNNTKYLSSNARTSSGDSLSSGYGAELYKAVYSCGRNDQYQLGLMCTNTNQSLPQHVLREYNIAHISYGVYHCVFVTNEGNAYSFGYNNQSMLGSGNTTNHYFHPYKLLTDVETVQCGHNFTMLLKKDGKLYACGDNTSYGQLGNGNQTDLNVPTLVKENVQQVVCGDIHTLILTVDGELYGCGYNGNGQLGDATTTNRISGFVLINIPTDHVIKNIYTGYRSSFYITEDARVFAFGYNGHGELGLGDTTQRTTPTQVTTLPLDEVVQDIKQGQSHTLFLMNSNKVYTTGRNTEGQLGINSTTNQTTPIQTMGSQLIKRIGCIQYSSYFVNMTNRLFSCGQNNYGQLGDNSTTQRNSPVEIMSTTSDISKVFSSPNSQFVYIGTSSQNVNVASLDARFVQGHLECDFHVMAAGASVSWKIMATTIPNLAFTNVKTMIDIDFANSDAILSGELNTWSSADEICVPIKKVITQNNVEKSYTVNKAYVHIYCEDENGLYGYRSVNVITTGKPHPIIYSVDEVSPNVIKVKGSVFSDDTYIRQVILAGFKTTVSNTSSAISNMFKNKNNSKIFAKSYNDINKVIHFEHIFTHVFESASNDTFTQVENNLKYIDFRILVAASNGNEVFSAPFFITKVDTNIKHYYESIGIGQNNYNQLLFSNTTDTNVPKQIMLNNAFLYNVEFGNQYSVYIDDNKTAYAMGFNNYGQLGTNNSTNMTTEANKLSTGVKDVTCGNDFTVLLFEDGSVKGTGFNNYGQYSTNDVTNYKTLTPVFGDLKIKQVSSMYESTIYLTEHNTVVGSGRNDLGQLGTATATTYNVQVPSVLKEKIKYVSTGHHHAAMITSDNRVFMMGYNNVGQLGYNNVTNQTTPVQVLTSLKIIKAACGANHTIFLTDDFQVYATGTNTQGQLGDGTTTQHTSPVKVMITHKVIDIYAGQYNSMFKLANGDIYVTGYNNKGDLGLGNVTQQNTPVLLSAIDDIADVYLGRYSMSTILTKAYIDPSRIVIQKVNASPKSLMVTYDAYVLNSSRLYILASTIDNLTESELNNICGDYDTSIQGLDVIEYSDNFVVSVKEHRVTFVHDITNTPKPYGTVNAFTVYLRLVDLTTSQAKVTKHVIKPTTNFYGVSEDTTPYTIVHSGMPSGDDTISVKYSVFYSLGNITMNYIVGFNFDTSNTTESAIKTFILNNVSNSYVYKSFSTIERYTINMASQSVSTVFNSLSAKDTIDVVHISDTTRLTFYVISYDSNNNGFLSKVHRKDIVPFEGDFIKIYTVGLNNYYQLFIDGNITNQFIPTQVFENEDIKLVNITQNFGHIVFKDGSTKAVGYNNHGQLGNGNVTQQNNIIDTLSDYKVDFLTSGSYHVLFTTDEGEVYGCGHNNYGQLGDASVTARSTPVRVMKNHNVIDIVCGYDHTLFLTDKNKVYGCGRNDQGQLGDETVTSRNTPVIILPDLDIISMGASHQNSYFVTDNYELYVTGYNQYGELGDSSKLRVLTPKKININNEEILKVVGGDYHTVVLTRSNKVYISGRNNYGQLGTQTSEEADRQTFKQFDTDHVISDIAAGNANTFYITKEFNAYGLGRNDQGQLGDHSKFTRYDPYNVRIENQSIGKIFAHHTATSSSFGVINIDAVYSASNLVASMAGSINISVDLSSDMDNEYYYYAVAVTDPSVTSDTIISIINDPLGTYASAIYSGKLSIAQTKTVSMSLSKILVIRGTNSISVVDATTVNNARVFVYYTDIYQFKSITLTKNITPTIEDEHGNIVENNNPLIAISGVEELPETNQYRFTISVYSSINTINKYAMGIIDLGSQTEVPSDDTVKNFFLENVGTASADALGQNSVPLVKYVPKKVSIVLSKAFNGITSSTSAINIGENNNYLFRLVATDTEDNFSVAAYISRFELIKDYTFNFNYINNGTDRFFFNKIFNDKWCTLDSSGNIIYVWSAMRDSNAKYGIYVSIANPSSGSKSAPYEVKHDGSNNYVLPCVTTTNGKIIIAYQLNNGTSHSSTAYYNVLNYSGITISSNSEYTHGTETRDANSMTDIITMDTDVFAIVWNDYQQHPYYVGHCHRGGCAHHHAGWYYYYDIQFIIKNTSNTTILDQTNFENNDTNGGYLKVCYPHMVSATTHFAVVWHYYSHIYIDTYNKSNNTVVVNNKQVSTTAFTSWNLNQTNPVVIESITPDNFVIVWFDNYFTANHSNKIYIREMVGSSGAFATNEVLLDTTTNHYNYGKPKIFVNEDKYDLFVVRAELANAPNYPVYRYHYVLDASFNILERNIISYKNDLGFDILPHVGNPVNFIKLKEGKYQESVVHTSTTTTTEFDTYKLDITTGGNF